MTTREEFGKLVDNFEKQLETVCIRGSYNIIGQDPDTARAALLAAYDAQAERIAELEEALDIALKSGNGLVQIAKGQAARIEALEAALKALYDVANDIEDRTVDDGDGYTDSMQSRTLERACSKALAALKGQEA